MATISQSQVYTIALLAGLPQPKVMAAVAMAESSGRTDVVNSIGCVGLWQINQPVWVKQYPKWTVKWLQNPLNNASAAKVIYAAQGFKAWEAYTNGAYSQYLNKAVTEDTNLKNEAKTAGWDWYDFGDPLGVLPDPNTKTEGWSDVGGVTQGIGDIAGFLAKAGNWISNGENWLRILYVMGGAALFIGGATVIARPLVNQVATQVASSTPVGSSLKQISKAVK